MVPWIMLQSAPSVPTNNNRLQFASQSLGSCWAWDPSQLQHTRQLLSAQHTRHCHQPFSARARALQPLRSKVALIARSGAFTNKQQNGLLIRCWCSDAVTGVLAVVTLHVGFVSTTPAASASAT